MMETIVEAKEYLREHWEAGTKCPCCGQNVKLYKRKFNQSMAVCLIRLYRRGSSPGLDFYHIHDLQNDKLFRLHMNGGNFATMRYWGVIESLEKDDDDTTRRTSGQWKITPLGRFFVQNMINIPKYIYTYNMRLIKMGGQTTDIIESLSEKFDYQELMRGSYAKFRTQIQVNSQ